MSKPEKTSHSKHKDVASALEGILHFEDFATKDGAPGQTVDNSVGSSDGLDVEVQELKVINEMVEKIKLENESLQQELEEQRKKSAEFSDGWQRERAEFNNYKKRVERDQVLQRQATTGTVIKKYLVVLDDMERALKARPQDAAATTWADGIELIYRKLQGILESEGVSRIPAEKESFDPTRHEAITHEDSPDHESNAIIEVVQQGYIIGEKVLRPALVRVAK